MNKPIAFKAAFSLAFLILCLWQIGSNWNGEDGCKGAQKRVDDTFKVMDACQKLLGCTITIDDLREAQRQLNQAEVCK
jgi:hypothetical protein